MGEHVTFPSNGDTAEGHLSLPSGSGPGIIVIQEWWGLVPHIEELADRFAAAGFVALAPDLYHGEKTTEPDEAGKLMMSLRMDRAAKDIAGAADYLAGRPETSGERIGVVGFCMGGTLALWTPTITDRVSAAVGFYPAPFRGWGDLDTAWARYRGKAAVVHAAEGDGGTGAEHVQQAATAIRDSGGDVALYDYAGSQHAFFNDTRPQVYDQAAAEQAWERTLAFFRDRL